MATQAKITTLYFNEATGEIADVSTEPGAAAADSPGFEELGGYRFGWGDWPLRSTPLIADGSGDVAAQRIDYAALSATTTAIDFGDGVTRVPIPDLDTVLIGAGQVSTDEIYIIHAISLWLPDADSSGLSDHELDVDIHQDFYGQSTLEFGTRGAVRQLGNALRYFDVERPWRRRSDDQAATGTSTLEWFQWPVAPDTLFRSPVIIHNLGKKGRRVHAIQDLKIISTEWGAADIVSPLMFMKGIRYQAQN